MNEVYLNHSPYSLAFVANHSRPAPLLIQNGWTDDLFPPQHALRPYNLLRSRYPGFPVSLQFGDLGHSRGSNKAATNKVFFDQAARFFNAYLNHQGSPPPRGSVTAFTQTCPSTAPDGGPFRAPGWGTIHEGSLEFGSNNAKTFTSSGGNQSVAAQFDPIAGTTDSCKTIPITDEPNTATYRHLFSSPFTMLGRPTVRAQIATTGNFGEIAARLWDLTPDGQQRWSTAASTASRTTKPGRSSSSSTATATASARATGSCSSSSGATPLLPGEQRHVRGPGRAPLGQAAGARQVTGRGAASDTG